MASSNSTNPLSENVDPSIPLLTTSSSSSSPENDHSLRSGGRNTIREAARILRRASSRRMMREPSVLVREAAAEQLEERQSDWAYSRPVVVLDVVWNLAFVVVATVVLVLSRRELPGVPLRLWIVGYALQCTFHILCVCIEYRRRRRWGRPFVAEQGDGRRGSGVGVGEVSVPSPQGSQYVSLVQTEEEGTSSCAKYFESANTMFSFIWWIIGFYWVSSGGQTLALDSPQLYWLCIIFLAFDVFFVVFCVALACVIGIAVCCFLPCIIAILYAVADQEGASREDIEQLPKYKFEKTCHVDKQNSETRRCKGGIMIECGTATPTEHVLALDDSECCICLSAYDDGVELRELPCSHHFHCTCVDKWLHINATCPLCKYNILKSSDNQSGEEVQV